MRTIILISLTLLALLSIGSIYFYGRQMTHPDDTDHLTHATMSVGQEPVPREAGQSGFAAIAEIVSILNSDTNTDWPKVNISALREHLVDMELLTTEAAARQMVLGDKIIFEISGNGRIREAIQAMVPPHSVELNKVTNWNVSTEIADYGVRMILSPQSEIDRSQILALGFFGILATGSHHQAHHLAMAKGQTHFH